MEIVCIILPSRSLVVCRANWKTVYVDEYGEEVTVIPKALTYVRVITSTTADGIDKDGSGAELGRNLRTAHHADSAR